MSSFYVGAKDQVFVFVWQAFYWLSQIPSTDIFKGEAPIINYTFILKIYKVSWVVVLHSFNPCTREAEVSGNLSSSPTWST